MDRLIALVLLFAVWKIFGDMALFGAVALVIVIHIIHRMRYGYWLE